MQLLYKTHYIIPCNYYIIVSRSAPRCASAKSQVEKFNRSTCASAKYQVQKLSRRYAPILYLSQILFVKSMFLTLKCSKRSESGKMWQLYEALGSEQFNNPEQFNNSVQFNNSEQLQCNFYPKLLQP